MGFVVSFIGYKPVPRYDAVPWAEARVNEAATREGDYTEIDVIPFVDIGGLDADPADPMPRNITTDQATLASGWYKIVFADATDNTSQTAARFFNNAAPVGDAIPTVEEVRAESNVGFAEYGYPEPAAGQVDRLQLVLEESTAELVHLLSLKDVTLDFDAIDNPSLAVLTRRAIRALTEYNVAAGQQEKVDTASDFDMVSSFSLGPISETRRSISANANVLHPWPALNKLLLGIVSLATGGVLEGIDPRIPVIQSVENRTDVQQPGEDLMYAQRWMNTIFGDLRPLGVWRATDFRH